MSQTKRSLRTYKQRRTGSFEQASMKSFYSAILFGLSALPASVLSYSRYHTQEGVIIDPKGLRTLPITPFGGLPLQDTYYNILVLAHFYIATTILVLFAVQMFRRKGDALHVKVGKATQYLGLFCILEAFVMLFRHQRSDFAVYAETPGILPPILIWTFGMNVLTSNLHLFFVGRSPTHRVALGGVGFWAIALAGVLSLATIFCAYAYMIKNLLTAQGYHWEVNMEMAVLYSAYPIYDGLMLHGLWQWFRTKSLVDWRGHHAMTAVIATSAVLAPNMLFVAHDARLFWTYPGLNSMARLAMQLLPQWYLLGYYAERTVKHIVRISQAPTREKAE
jgi:uncharacterized membrane protein